MNSSRHGHMSWLIAIIAFMHLSGFAVFMKGFFPSKNHLEGYAVHNDSDLLANVDGQRLRSLYDRMVVVLIDALRADNVYESIDMPYLSKMINSSRTQTYTASAHPPTVTMPRIKAMTSGDIPGFIDVVLNFDSQELRIDNLITQLYRNERKLVFYGDDTWLRLFPHHFIRSEGTTSFFVTDYTEVDVNVTRHLDNEIRNSDWNVLILHYLGLDHIGHTAGPKSPLVPPKLNEMDQIIEKLDKELIQLQGDKETLLVVCGDHGMSDQGSHGGSSPSETITPFIMIADRNISVNNRPDIYQIDTVPLLSVLLGLPIPLNNLGVISKEGLKGYSPKEKLTAFYQNAKQIANLYSLNIGTGGGQEMDSYNRAYQAHMDWLKQGAISDHYHKIINLYSSAAIKMRNSLSKSLLQYDMHAIITGIMIIWMVMLSYITIIQDDFQPVNVPTSLSIWLPILSLFVIATVQVVICTSSYKGETLCPKTHLHLTAVGMFYCGLALQISWILLCTSGMPKLICSMLTRFKKSGTILLILGTLGHALSLMSSSFVEEEHQTWYFFTTTVYIAMFARLVQMHFVNIETSQINDDSCENFLLVKEDSTNGKQNSRFIDYIFIGSVFILNRILRAWNQTGDKWSHLPDIGDWLVRPENKNWLSALVCSSLCMTYVIFIRKGLTPVYRLLLAVSLLVIYLFRARTDYLWLPFANNPSSKGIFEAQIVFAALFAMVVSTLLKQCFSSKLSFMDVRYEGTFVDGQCALCVLGLLLLRPHNIVQFSMNILLEHLLSSNIIPKLKNSQFTVMIIYLWIGNAAFFQQGNSNSISTVDVSAGYVGLSGYNPVIIGILMAISTFIGPLFWMTSFIKLLVSKKRKRSHQDVIVCCASILLFRCIVIAFFSINAMVLRYHLFVWTVFSPKILYEGMYTLVTMTFVLATLCLKYIQPPDVV
ncbi:GPI ethanolamine phosphate transferase 2, catalytic subunit-like [Tubulanus polymorphus]|uniref:GPI ethanolamine phosphate transferase 2, catalytic subunit-like n=1 Tax=Tubulanus polymorphus TaxID=672921 RepID=UPI003DA2B49B